MSRIPRLVWWIAGALLVLVLVVVLKVDVHLGYNGASITQGLVH